MSDDLIRRSDAIKATWQEPTYTDPLNVLTEVRDRIKSIPSADRPSAVDLSSVYSTAYKSGYEKGKTDRPQGKWIEVPYDGRIYGIYRIMYKCSNCGYVPMHRGEPIIPTASGILCYCPSCGAKMKGADDE